MAAGDLTTKTKVKDYLEISDAASDSLIDEIILGVSASMKRYMSRDVLTTVYSETRNGHGGTTTKTRQYPITAVTSVTINDIAVPAATLVADAGYRYDANGFTLNGYSFSRGSMNVALVYTAGSASVPADIDKACYQQVGYEFRKRQRVGDRGKALGAGLSASFEIDAWLPEVKAVMDNYKKVAPV